MRESAVAQDCPQNVVEVMRNAAGQCTDRLHLLRLPELRLQLFLVDLRLPLRGYIARRTDEPQRLAGRVAQTPAARGQPTPIAVRVANTIFAFIAASSSLAMVRGCCLKAPHVL